MDSFAWLFIIVVTLCVAWFVGKLVLALRTARQMPQLTARQLIKKELRHQGVRPEEVGELCLCEIADQVVHKVKAQLQRTKGHSLTSLMVEQSNRTAMGIALYVTGGRVHHDFEPILHILKRHNVDGGPVDVPQVHS